MFLTPSQNIRTRRQLIFLLLLSIGGCGKSQIDPKVNLAPDNDFKSTPLLLSDDANDVIWKAAKNYGGKPGFARWKCGVIRHKSIVAAEGQTLEATVEDTFDLPRHCKRVSTIGEGPMAKSMTWVTKDREGWFRWDHEAAAKPLEPGWPEKTEHELGKTFDILGMSERATTIRDAGLEARGDEMVRVVRLGTEAGPFHELYLNPKKGLLVASKIVDPDADPENPSYVECEFNDYRLVQGGMIPFHIRGTKRGQLLMDVKFIDVQFFESINPRAFAKP